MGDTRIGVGKWLVTDPTKKPWATVQPYKWDDDRGEYRVDEAGEAEYLFTKQRITEYCMMFFLKRDANTGAKDALSTESMRQMQKGIFVPPLFLGLPSLFLDLPSLSLTSLSLFLPHARACKKVSPRGGMTSVSVLHLPRT